jgi:hypothetical protein
VFPSIAPTPKGERVRTIIAQAQLRPATVLFVDDQPAQRAEVLACNPGINVADPAVLSTLLDDPRCRGGEDPALTRVAHYRLLERRQRDLATFTGDNRAFLRASGIRVRIDFDLAARLDRAVELINRTNQLNFTKLRLPEAPEAARAELTALVGRHDVQAGLVELADLYGDYGAIGLFVVQTGVDRDEFGARRRLVHFCFSCRTLGMRIESWVYRWLGRPELAVVGPVAADPIRDEVPDWISQTGADGVTRRDGPAARPAVPEIRYLGGCEAEAICFYLRPETGQLRVRCNFQYGALFHRVNSVATMFGAAARRDVAFLRECAQLGMPYPLLTGDFLGDAVPGTLFVFNGGADARPTAYPRYRHVEQGWELILEPFEVAGVDLTSGDEAGLLDRLALSSCAPSPHFLPEIRTVMAHLRQNYRRVAPPDEATLAAEMRRMIESVPAGSRLILLLNESRLRRRDGRLVELTCITDYNRRMEALAAAYPHVTVLRFGDFLADPSEILIGDNHFDRVVYWRVAEEIRRLATAPLARAGQERGSFPTLSLGAGLMLDSAGCR